MKSSQIVISRRVALCGVAGMSVFALIQVLTLRGIMAPWWFVAMAIAVVALIDGTNAPTSILTLTAVVGGLLPVAGFLSLPPQLSTLGLVLGCCVTVKAMSISRTGVSVSLSGVAVVTPAVAGGAFTYWWWSQLIEGSTEEILTRLMPQWDLSEHFLLFSSAVRDGKYLLLASPQSDGYVWAAKQYPAGIHYVWSQFGLPLRGPSEIDRSVLIPFFALVIVLTGAAAVAVISLGLARLGDSTLACVLNGIVGSTIGAAAFCAGPLSSSFWAGFANVPAVVAATAILISFLLRPIHNRSQLWLLVFGVIALSLNWFPMTGLFALPLLVVLAKTYKLRPSSDFITLAMLGVVIILPLMWLLRTIGLERFIESTGSVNEFPETLLIGGAIFALGVAILMFGKIRLEVTLMLASPAFLLYGLGRYMMNEVDELRYYFDKFGLFAGMYLVLMLASIIITHVQNNLILPKISKSNQIRIAAGLLVVSVSTTQVFGYWGPELKGLETETVGSIQRTKMLEEKTKASDFRPLSKVVLQEAVTNRARDFAARSCTLLVLPKNVATDAADSEYELIFGNTDPANSLWLANVWLHSLSDSGTTEVVARLPRTPELGRVFDDYPPLPTSKIDETISGLFEPNEVCILSTKEINTELKKLSPTWQTFDIKS